jgi:hypothetical protein
MKKILSIAEIVIIIVVALAPLFATFPYRINIFLSWEGAYRIAEGQLPYRDFGMPVGYVYWLIPALFFKIFGPFLITLIKAQAFINLLSGFAFRSIFKSTGMAPEIRFLAVLVFSLSYTFPNYWPWYNHTVFVLELIALAFLFRFFFGEPRKRIIWLVIAGCFAFLSFFTKQDGGGLCLLLCLALIIYHCWFNKRWIVLIIFIVAFAITGLLMILPFAGTQIGYWFNVGQAPHSSRLSITDIIREFLGASHWLKFYVFIIALLLIAVYHRDRSFFRNYKQLLLLLLTAGILAQAAIFQVTSYVPVDNNIFFHAFGVAYILFLLSQLEIINWIKPVSIVTATAGVLLWWSQVYWKYIDRFVLRGQPATNSTHVYEGHEYGNEVNRNTYMINLDTTDIPLHQWRIPNSPSFKKILVPGPTADGIERLLALPLLKQPDFKVLNMSELTPLANDIPFKLETGPHYPLWYHKGVGMFERETDMFVRQISSGHYDLVLFEYIPYLNNFYPFAVRSALQQHYYRIDRFPAPRKPSSDAWVEIYVRKPLN